MFKDYASVEILAREAIRVEHFATTDLLYAKPNDPVGEVLAWMTGNDFDVVPVGQDRCIGFVEREDLKKAERTANLAGSVRPLSESVVLSPSTSLEAAIHRLVTMGWFFLGEDGRLEGIATRHDLGKPAASLYLFAKTMIFESGLRRLLGTYGNTPIPDAAPDEDSDEIGPKYLREVILMAKRNKSLLHDLGYAGKGSGGRFDEITNFVNRLRNHIAHGRSILAISESKYSHAMRIEEFDLLLSRIKQLSEERVQVWAAYASTQIVRRTVIEEAWTGDSAISLPGGDPMIVLTAANPHEEVLGQQVNDERNRELLNVLRQRGYDPIPVEGRSSCGRWKEDSFAIQGMTRAEAGDLCRMFRQRAFFEIMNGSLVVVSADGEEKALLGKCENH